MENEKKNISLDEFSTNRPDVTGRKFYERRFSIGYDTGDGAEERQKESIKQFEGVHQHTNGVISNPDDSQRLVQLKNSLKAALKSASAAIS